MIYTEILLAYWYEPVCWIGFIGTIVILCLPRIFYILAVKKAIREQK